MQSVSGGTTGLHAPAGSRETYCSIEGEKAPGSSATSSTIDVAGDDEIKASPRADTPDAINEKDAQLANDVHAERAEQSIIADIEPQELAPDLPSTDRSLGLGLNSQGALSKEHVALDAIAAKDKVAAEKKSINPYVNYRRAKKLQSGKLVTSKIDGKPYDQNLPMALHDTYWKRLYFSAFCLLCSGETAFR